MKEHIKEKNKNGHADYDENKRKVTWEVKDVKGGKTKALDFVLTYEKDTMLDDFQFKQLGPFTMDFDIPNYTASGVRVKKMDAKFMDYQPTSLKDKKEPAKWLRHKTLCGSYVCRF